MGSIFTSNIKKDLFVLLVGLLSFVKIRMMGTFAVAELIALVAFPILLFKQVLEVPSMRKFLFWSVMWLVGTYLADTFNDTSFENTLKGNINVLMLILSIPFVYWMFKDNPKRIIWFWMGNAFSCLYNFYFQKPEILSNEVEADVWGIYAYRTMFIVIPALFYFYHYKKIAYLIILGYGFYSLFHFSRNIFLLNAIVVVIMWFINRNEELDLVETSRMIKKKIVVLIFYMILAAGAVTAVYSTLADNGVLGERVQRKYYEQKNAKGGFASGRSEWFVGTYIALHKPILGYGSYAVDKNNLSGEYSTYYGDRNGGRGIMAILPGHSFILGGWLFSGILGLLFFLYILKVLVTYIYRYAVFDGPLFCLNLSMISVLIWNDLFSPFADRLLLLCTCIPLLILSDNYKQQYKLDNE